MVEWDVDERRATLWARLYVLGMRVRRDKDAFTGAEHTLRIARRKQAGGNAHPTPLLRARRHVGASTRAGLQVWTVRPRRRPPQIRVVYLHGGGYVHPLSADYWRLVRSLTRVPAEVQVLEYPLAPDATVDDVLPRVADVVEAAGTELPVVVMGDSAGGAMAIAASCELRARASGTRPVGIVALCPWLDATLGEAGVRELEPSDPMLDETGLRAAGRWWAGDRDPGHPSVSPVNAELDGLPPLWVFIGDHDILRPGIDLLAERAGHQDVDLHVHEVPAMFHVWMTRPIPEARRTRRDLRRLLRQMVRGPGVVPTPPGRLRR